MFKYYEDDSSRLGKPLPLPTIEEVNEIGNGQKMYKFKWDGDGVTEDCMTEDFFSPTQAKPQNKCNTEKDKVRRLKNQTLGVFITAR